MSSGTRRLKICAVRAALLPLLLMLSGCPDVTPNPDPDPDPNPGPSDSSVSFQVAVQRSSDAGPEAITTALLNGDTFPDIISANRSSNTVSFWYSTGAGTYAAAARHVTRGEQPRSVAVDAVATDGATAIIVANWASDDISVIRIDAAGNRDAAVEFALPEGASPRDVASGDLNGDGIGDIATANEGLNSVSVFLGDGAGSFSEPVNYLTGANPRSIALADFDGDDSLDIVTANRGSDSLTVLSNDGAGDFPTSFDVPTGDGPRMVSVADLDRDGNLDLLASSPTSSAIAVHRGGEDGRFETVVFHTLDSNPTRIVVGNFTEDNHLDVLAVLFENDTATVSSGRLACLSGDGNGGFELHADFSVAPGVIDLAADDLDRDGDSDVVISNTSEDFVGTIVNTGRGFATERRYPTGTRPRMAKAGDMDRDGNLDLLVGNLDSRDVTFLPGDGDGGFGDGQSIPAGGKVRAIALGQINGDNNLDMVATNLDESRVAVFTGRGDGTFDSAEFFDVRNSDSTRSAEPRSIVLADINNDDDLDLVVGNANRDSVAILLGAGDGTFGSPVEYDVANFPLSVQVADLDNDGALDIIVANGVDADGTGTQASALHLLPGNGDGTFDIDSMVGYVVNAGPGSLVAADLDQDGDIDLAASSNSLNSVQTFNGRGDGRLSSGSVFAMGTSPNAVGVTDIDGDGLADLFVTNDGGTVSYRLNDDRLGFGSRASVRIGESPIEALLIDLNGDRHVDIVTPNRTSNNISVVLGGPTS
jgi:hypothetical protein